MSHGRGYEPHNRRGLEPRKVGGGGSVPDVANKLAMWCRVMSKVYLQYKENCKMLRLNSSLRLACHGSLEGGPARDGAFDAVADVPHGTFPFFFPLKNSSLRVPRNG